MEGGAELPSFSRYLIKMAVKCTTICKVATSILGPASMFTPCLCASTWSACARHERVNCAGWIRLIWESSKRPDMTCLPHLYSVSRILMNTETSLGARLHMEVPGVHWLVFHECKLLGLSNDHIVINANRTQSKSQNYELLRNLTAAIEVFPCRSMEWLLFNTAIMSYIL